MTQRRMSIAAIIVALAGTLVACGGSDGDSADGGGSPSGDFCTLLGASSGGDLEGDEGLAELKAIAAAAPDSLSGDFELFVGAVEKLNGLDENDPAAFEAVFELILDPKFVAAGENLEKYATEECGLDPGVFETNESDDFSADDFDTGTGFDEEIDPNVISLDGVSQYLDQQFGETTWRSDISGYSLAGDRALEVSGDNLEADALEICAAVLAYATAIDPAASVQVTDSSVDNVWASTLGDGTCQPG